MYRDRTIRFWRFGRSLFLCLGLMLGVSLLTQVEGSPLTSVTEPPPVVLTQGRIAAVCDTVSQIPTSECLALGALYSSTNGTQWISNTGWLTSTTPCDDWYGVSCTNGRVATLLLENNGLEGTLPPEIGDFISVTIMALHQNQLHGTIPNTIGNLTALERLDLSQNLLTGPIPVELGTVTTLQVISFNLNDFTGTIPPELGNLTNLVELHLASNKLEGSIPAELGNLTQLVALWLGDNNLTGEIPASLGNLVLLEGLSLSINQLSGPIPPELGNLTPLRELFLGTNQLTGTIPATFENLTNLEVLGLNQNQLTGSIPPWLGSLSNLWHLSLWGNSFTGTIPPELGNLTNLVELYLDSNELEGSIPAELGNLTQLVALWLGNNNLTGEIPASLGNLVLLEGLSLSINQLSGPIPPELGNLTPLRELFLGTNQLTGTIPATFENLTNLEVLGLNQNQLTGSIPPWLGSLSNLWHLSLWGNTFTGTIPPELGNLTNLKDLFLNQNQLMGEIPATLGNLTLLRLLDLSENQLTGSIPSTLGALNNLQELLLSNNQLSGSIPPQLGDLQNLVSLQLAINQLTGIIPAELGQLTNLENLWLQGNQLTGTIPDSLAALVNLRGLRLNDNQLTGTIPLWVAELPRLEVLWLSENQLSGTIPPSLGNLPLLRELALFSNQLSGTIPPSLGNLSNLTTLSLSYNQLTGPIPPEIGNLTGLITLNLRNNQLTGTIPASLGNLRNLQELILRENRLEGRVPATLGNLTNLTLLSLANNALEGPLPSSLVHLTQLNTNDPGHTNLAYNKLFATDPRLIAFLNAKDPDWAQTQTVVPTNFKATTGPGGQIDLRWDPIPYTDDGGFYEIRSAFTTGGPYTTVITTTNKLVSAYTIENPPAGAQFFVIRSYTPPHAEQVNELWSDDSLEVSTMVHPIHLIAVLAFDNDLDYYLSDVLERMRQGTAANPNVVVTVLADGALVNDSEVVLIAGGLLTHTEMLPWAPTMHEIDTSNPVTLADFLQWARDQHSTHRTTVTFLGHGVGWAPEIHHPSPAAKGNSEIPVLPQDIPRTPTDVTNGTYMSTPELGRALLAATENGTKPFDLVFFDSCFYGSLEVLYEVRQTAKVFIASPNYAWASFPYQEYLTHFTPSVTVEALAQALMDEYQAGLTTDNPNAIFWIRGADIPPISAAVQALGEALLDALQTNSAEAEPRILQATLDSQFVDTTLCLNDLDLCPPDEMVGVSSFAGNLQLQFPPTSTVYTSADALISQLQVVRGRAITGRPWQRSEHLWDYADTISILGALTPTIGIDPPWRYTVYTETTLPSVVWLPVPSQTVAITAPLAFTLENSWDNFLAAWYEPATPTVGALCHSFPVLPDGPTVHVRPALQVVEAGKLLSTTVSISQSLNLGAFQVTLVYNPNLISVTNVTLADFPGSTGRDVVVIGPDYDHANGRVTFRAYSIAATPAIVGPDGYGALMIVQYLALEEGVARLDLVDVRVNEADATPLPIETRNGMIVIHGCLGDFDADGEVDIDDVSHISYRWNSRCGEARYGALYDMDQNCHISAGEVQMVAVRWGTVCGILKPTPSTTAVGLWRALIPTMFTPALLTLAPPDRVTAGQLFTVGVQASGFENLGAFEFTVDYDPNAIEIVSLVPGTFPGSEAHFLPLGPIEIQTGTLAFGGYISQTLSGPSGDGTLAILTARALQPTTAPHSLVLQDGALYVLGGDAIETAVQSCPDCNADGIVDVADLVALSERWTLNHTQYGWHPNFDLDHDRNTDVGDMTALAGLWGQLQ